MSGLLSRIHRRWQTDGPIGVFNALGRRCYRSNSAIWFQRGLLAPLADSPALLPVQVMLDRSAETLAYLRAQSHVAPELELAEQEGHLLPHALHQGQIVGVLKIGYPRVYITDYWRILTLPPGIAFLYDSYVAPELRGQRILGQMVTEAMTELRRRGLTHLLCHIPAWNLASQKAYRRCGFEPIGQIAYRRVLGVSIFLPFHPRKLLARMSTHAQQQSTTITQS